MKPERLRNELHRITAHEEQYRKGYYDPRADAFPRIMIDGIEVMQFSYAKISAESDGNPFQVRKHSRFRNYPLHIHDWIELSYCYSGTCTQIIGTKEYSMKTGQMLLMAPNTIHTIAPLGEEDILVQISLGQKYLTNNFFNRLSSSSMVSNFFIDAFNESRKKNNFFLFHSEEDERLRLFVEEFMCEWYDPSLASLDILNSLFSLIVSELVNVMDKTFEHARNRGGYTLPLLRYIEHNYRTCTLNDAAEEFGLNPNYLSSLLKTQLGMTFNELVVQEKLSAAEKLLINSDMSVSDIINYVGYQNMSYFYRKFKERYHCLPGEYRDRAAIGS